MPSPLEKAWQDPGSMKARILNIARQVFGATGYDGATTRMIAQAVGIDISTLYYHWGEKRDLYEAVIQDIGAEIQNKFQQVENLARGKTRQVRLEIAIEVMCDYLFADSAVARLVLFDTLSRERHGASLDLKMAEHLRTIAVAMGLAPSREQVSPEARARILVVWHGVLNFIAGETLFRPLLDTDISSYRQVVKDTLKCILIPAFG